MLSSALISEQRGINIIKMPLYRNQKRIAFIFCFISAFLILMICSKCSFLYPLNDWVDSNCFFTVGKSMLMGKVPYLDLYEQKGPLLYFIHMLSAIISFKSFIGIFIFEVIAATFALYGFYLIISLYADNYAVYFVPFIALGIYTSSSFSAGDSAEEFCIPLLVWTMFFTIDSIKNNTDISRKRLVLIGMFASSVLMIKYTMLGFYIGWFIALFITACFKRSFKKLINVLWLIPGACLVIIPFVLYFALNEGLTDFYNVYFMDNIRLYASHDYKTLSLLLSKKVNTYYSEIISSVSDNLLFSIPGIAGIICLFFQKRKILGFQILSCWFFTTFFLFLGRYSYLYYSLILAAFSFTGYIPLACFLKKHLRHSRLKILLISSLSILLCCICSYWISANTYMMKYTKDDLPQYKFAEIMSQDNTPSLCNYGFLDGGFYTASGIVPHEKFFCKLNIPKSGMLKSQDFIVANGLVDYVITRGTMLPSYLSSNYFLAGQASFPYIDGGFLRKYVYNFPYFLYKKTEKLN